jgi:hypothetical protein|tara:strand:+ start:2209 stop:2538 length:330 start_codon:yes stop_codon:yes gene_type:complete
MSAEIDYGKLNKRIVFTENDHRHAQLVTRLRYDSLTQSDFFRSIVTGYIQGDERIAEFVDDVKQQSEKRKTKSKKLRTKGKNNIYALGLDDKQLIDDIFDTIAEEHPDL